MTALHKPERTTYGQAVEAQHNEYFDLVICTTNPRQIRCEGTGESGAAVKEALLSPLGSVDPLLEGN